MSITRSTSLLLAVCMACALLNSALGQSQQKPFGAILGVTKDGYHYIKCFNTTEKRLSLSITYTKHYADGQEKQNTTTAIVEPGELDKTVDKCSIRTPTEKIDAASIKVTDMQIMN